MILVIFQAPALLLLSAILGFGRSAVEDGVSGWVGTNLGSRCLCWKGRGLTVVDCMASLRPRQARAP